MKRSLLLLGLFVASLAMLAAVPAAYASTASAKNELKTAYPHVDFYQQGKQITRVYGQAFGSGSSATDATERFRFDHSDLFGIDPDDLKPESILQDKSHTRQVMYNRDTGQYKFTLVYYSQFKDGIPVFKSELRLLVRNEPGYPIVLASSELKNLGKFEVDRAQASINPAQVMQSFSAQIPEMTNFSEPRLVIWAGYDGEIAEPALGVEFIADNGKPATEKMLYIIDPGSGDILYEENLIIFEDVAGNVSGLATDNFAAEQCDAEVSMPMSYARVNIGATMAYADSSGDFTIPNGGSSPVTVSSPVRGEWFHVYNNAGAESQIDSLITPPGPVNFMHNASNSEEYVRAEVNGYIHSNLVRDFTLKYNPTYPTIWNQTDWPVYVNDNTGYCPGNAWYDYSSITFCLADDGYTNTAFSTIIHHEYGHHLVASAGSGQGQYGEGMGDVMGILITDDPGLAYGFYVDDCVNPMRTGDNTLQYPCSGEIHDCGQLISACVWDIRNELVITEPTDYIDVISNLAVNSMLLHTGTEITPQITIDYLTLDDDDGNIYNGTPHYDEINTGFSAHNMPGPELQTGLSVSPSVAFVSEGPSGGPFVPENMIYTLENMDETGINYTVTTGQTWITISNPFGYLAGGATVEVTLSINSNAESFPDGRYEGVVDFVNTTNHDGDTSRDVILNVGIPMVIYEWTMDTNPGWTTEGQWAHGQPTGGGGEYGSPDPTGGYTGNNVYGYNLYGDYESGLPETHLTSGALDCTGLSNVTLKFWRWLGVEQPLYDHAYIKVSNNGSTWTTIWENTEEVADYSWSEHEFDIASVADNQSTVYLRWTMGAADGLWQYCGWNIDDIQIIALGGEEPPLSVLLPYGVPEYLDPGVSTSFTVQIVDGAESYVPGSGTHHYRYNGGSFLTSALVSIGGNMYEATLPAADCSASPEFYVSADGDGGATINNPPDAPSNFYWAIVGEFTTFFEDNFETDQGWSVSGDATDGQWDRGTPVGLGERGDPPTDYDGSGQCYLTDNVYGNSDVDGGTTYLISPTFDLSDGNALFNYALWYTNNNGDDPNNDLFVVWVSNNNGSSWTHVETFGPASLTSWTEHSFLVDDFITPTSLVRVRFEASDLNSGSVVEAGIDAVSISSFVCDSVAIGTIAGTVTDDGGPIVGVTVFADDGLGNTGSDVTTVDGTYSIDLPPSSYDVDFSHTDYYDTTITGVVVTVDATTTVDVVLESSLPSVIAGTITDGSDPIVGVQVFADDGLGNTGSDVTASNGTYSIEVPPGTYEVDFSHVDYFDTSVAGIAVTEHNTTTLNMVMVAGTPSAIAGTVTDYGVPIEGVLVFADDGSGNTGSDNTASDGTYYIELLPGTYDVDFTHINYIDTTATGIIVVDYTVTTLDVEMMMIPPGDFSGTVTDNDAAPIQDVLVELIDGVDVIGSDLTDSDGNYSLGGVFPGTYDLDFSKTGYYDVTEPDVEVLSGESTIVNITLHRLGTFSGVVDDYYGAPVEDVYVSAIIQVMAARIIGEEQEEAGVNRLSRIKDDSGKSEELIFKTESDGTEPVLLVVDPVENIYTNSVGEFELVLMPGDYVATFEKAGWTTFTSAQFTIFDDTDMENQDVVFRSPGSLSGVVDDGTVAIEGIHVTVEDDVVLIGEDYSDIAGAYSIGDIYDGDYTVTFSHVDYQTVVLTAFQINDGPSGTIQDQTLSELAGYPYLAGDVNMYNGNWPPTVIGGDVTYLVNFFRGVEASVPCLITGFWASADANGDCLVIGSDVTKLVSYFRGTGDLSFCVDYEPLWPTPDDLPVEAPDGWPNCNVVPATAKVVPSMSE